ncbi:unnamed protein product, partial [Staurois parvus]
WGPWAIGDHGIPVFLPKLKKAYEKGTRGISWGPLLTQMASPPLPSFRIAQIAPHSHEKRCRHIFFAEPESDCMGVHTHAI